MIRGIIPASRLFLSASPDLENIRETLSWNVARIQRKKQKEEMDGLLKAY